MAEVTGLRNNALPYPVYGVPWGVVFPFLDADGDLVTGATTPDAEVSLNGNTFADCTNESTEIATNSGMWYLLLTAAELTADVVAIIAKSATAGMKTTPIVLYPRKLVTLRTGTVAANAADGTTLQLDSSASAVDDFYNGMLLVAVIDAVTEARIISDYVGSTKVCTVSPAYNTAPDNNDTFTVYLPDGGMQVVGANAVALGGTAQTGRDVGASVLLSAGTGTGQLDFTSGVVKSSLVQILGTALTETAGQIAAAFKKWFDVAAPVGTVNSIPNATAGAAGGLFIAGTNAATTITTGLTTHFIGTVDTVTTYTGNTPQTGDNYARLGAPAGASVSADVAAVKVDTAAIKTKTDNLPSDPADASDIAGAFSTVNSTLATIAGYIDTEVAAIKAKTDLIPGTIDGKTFIQGWTLSMSVLLGKASGLATTTAVYRAVDDSKDRVTATVDADGNRSAVTLDAS